MGLEETGNFNFGVESTTSNYLPSKPDNGKKKIFFLWTENLDDILSTFSDFEDDFDSEDTNEISLPVDNDTIAVNQNCDPQDSLSEEFLLFDDTEDIFYQQG